jgi:hypothetical protein
MRSQTTMPSTASPKNSIRSLESSRDSEWEACRRASSRWAMSRNTTPMTSWARGEGVFHETDPPRRPRGDPLPTMRGSSPGGDACSVSYRGGSPDGVRPTVERTRGLVKPDPKTNGSAGDNSAILRSFGPRVTRISSAGPRNPGKVLRRGQDAIAQRPDNPLLRVPGHLRPCRIRDRAPRSAGLRIGRGLSLRPGAVIAHRADSGDSLWRCTTRGA